MHAMRCVSYVFCGQGQLLEGAYCLDAETFSCHACNMEVVDAGLLSCFCDI